eukprot:TRINITY_DN12778_c0_g1_i1.p1 TRINITY_DN12778_c0_g1~~TRINITY_DN12778_c0_g1_i1.p1  ORF type:complete len:416 (+),score=49.84 TRINITY_DN12778_c0_g1_i1:88-1335(+)
MVVRTAFAAIAGNITREFGVVRLPSDDHSAALLAAVARNSEDSVVPEPVRRTTPNLHVNGPVHLDAPPVRASFGASVSPVGWLGWNGSAASLASSLSGLLQLESNVLIEGSATRARKACESSLLAGASDCEAENRQILGLFIALSFSIILVLCLCLHLREDKEDQITPLCPQLIVKGGVLKFKLILETSEEGVDVTDLQGNRICRVVTLRPDPLRPGYCGVAATVCLHNDAVGTLATVVARNVSAMGQGICLCNSSDEIFGFVEHDSSGRNHTIRHRSGVNVMKVACDFASSDDIVMTSPVGVKVCIIRQKPDGVFVGEACQHSDVGLVICCLFAACLSKQLKVKPLPSPWDVGAPCAGPPKTALLRDPGSSEQSPPVDDERAGVGMEATAPPQTSSSEQPLQSPDVVRTGSAVD